MTIDWTDRFVTGIAEIDSQHQQLVDWFNQLDAACEVGRGREQLAPLLAALVDYTCFHFVSEERMLYEHQYPGLEEHLREHAALSQQVLNLRRGYAEGNADLTPEILDFLRNWLSDHILGTDHAAMAFVQDHGCRTR